MLDLVEEDRLIVLFLALNKLTLPTGADPKLQVVHTEMQV